MATAHDKKTTGVAPLTRLRPSLPKGEAPTRHPKKGERNQAVRWREMRAKARPPEAPATICAMKPAQERALAIGVIS
jgi:hypothetical protein